MKQFSCGDVVPGCQMVFHADTDDAILQQVAAHATADHGMTDIPPEVVTAVRSNIRLVA